jgi:hypothetical protein
MAIELLAFVPDPLAYPHPEATLPIVEKAAPETIGIEYR